MYGEKKSECRLVLGTAQLGMNYGIANKTGQPDQRMATEIIREAWENGIREFDTAQAYGTSEHVLGKALSYLGIEDKVKIISKFNPHLDHLNYSVMSYALEESLNRMGISSLYALMLHGEELLPLWNKGLAKIFNDFVLSSKVKRIGVSVYTPHKALEALNNEEIDMVQIPANILDRRFEKAGVFDLALKKGKRVYIRSVFLQGLILMKVEEIPDEMEFARPVIKQVERLAGQMGLSREGMALGYIKRKMPETHVIFGAESIEQVKKNIACWEKSIKQNLTAKVEHTFSDIDEVLLRPDLWPK